MRSRPVVLLTLCGTLALLNPGGSIAGDSEPPLDNGRGPASKPAVPLLRSLPPVSAVPDAVGPRSDLGAAVERVQYFVHPEDVSIQGSHCVGLDCSGAEAFGFDTIRLKENNTQIKFEDTSSLGGFPSADWSLRANDTNAGGRDGFFLDEVSGGRTPLSLIAGAPTNSIYLAATGLLGLGTASPTAKVHATYGDTPTLRMDQDGSFGWPAYVWDAGGNEANYFVRDVTGGGGLPFRIKPGSGANSIVATSAGLGLGTDAPGARLDLQHAAPTMKVTNTTSATTTFSLDAGGNLTLSGLLFESSSRALKENLTPVDTDGMLDRVARLPLYTWNYRSDEAATTHVGPVAEDFAATFGLGRDDAHIASLDAAGVALGAIQALARSHREKDARIAALEAKLLEQGAALEHLGGELKALLDRVGTK